MWVIPYYPIYVIIAFIVGLGIGYILKKIEDHKRIK
jgi:uncharacterized membrane-anchored protein YhcB (DUF1043 family)